MTVESGYQDGIRPYLLADKGYLLLSWIIISFKNDGHSRSLAIESYFNKCHRCSRNVVENAFDLLKERIGVKWEGRRTYILALSLTSSIAIAFYIT